MKVFRYVVIILVFLSFLMPTNVLFAQNDSADEIEQMEEFAAFEESVHDTLPVKVVSNGNAATQKEESKKVVVRDKDAIQMNNLFFVNIGIDIIAILIIIIFIYYPNNRRREYIFTFVLFNVVIFLLTYVLNEVKISMGAAFGLFAVFSMLRYRTSGISMKDMTYLFIFIAVGLLNAIHLEVYEIITVNGILIVLTFILDSKFLAKRIKTKRIQYDNTDLIKPENYDKLVEDLKERTGLDIKEVTVGRIDFLKDSANVKIYFNE